VHNERQAIVALREMKQWKHETMEDYYDRFLQLRVIIPRQLDDVYLRETFREGLKKKLKLTNIRMPRVMIVKVANSAREIEEEMPTTCRSRQSQPLLDNENSDEESVDDEQKKERRKNRREQDDGN
jgi:hypothetical protein